MDWFDLSSTEYNASTSANAKRSVASWHMAKSALQALLDRAERKLGHKQDVAAKIGITPSRYSKLYKGNDYSLNVANCFRLARILKVPTQDVLRAAGKHDIAVALDEMFASADLADRLISDDEERLLETYRTIPTQEWRELAVQGVELMAKNSLLLPLPESLQPESQTTSVKASKARGTR